MAKCRENLLLQSRPLREDAHGNMTALFVCPADKADGIEYVRNKLGIEHYEMVMAGNESNDISMANLTLKGAFFICVRNAAQALIDFINTLKSNPANTFPNHSLFTERDGVEGIAQGLRKIMQRQSPKQ